MEPLTLIAISVMGFVMYRMAIRAREEMKQAQEKELIIEVEPTSSPMEALGDIRLWCMDAVVRLYTSRAHPYAEGTQRRLVEMFEEVRRGLDAKDRE